MTTAERADTSGALLRESQIRPDHYLVHPDATISPNDTQGHTQLKLGHGMTLYVDDLPIAAALRALHESEQQPPEPEKRQLQVGDWFTIDGSDVGHCLAVDFGADFLRYITQEGYIRIMAPGSVNAANLRLTDTPYDYRGYQPAPDTFMAEVQP